LANEAAAFDPGFRPLPFKNSLASPGVSNTEEQIKRIKTKLAQRIMEYAMEGEPTSSTLKSLAYKDCLTYALIEFGCRGK
jgi:hypothetical protein